MGDEYVRDEKWTKGPWFSNDNIESAGDATRFVLVVDGREDAIARVMAYGRRKGTKSDDEYEANARLIAAAPTFADIAARAQYMANQRGDDYGDLTKDELCALMIEYDNALITARGNRA